MKNYFFFLILCALFVSFGAPAQAMTTEERLESLESRVNALTATSTEPLILFNTNLTLGDSGSEVVRLQKYLLERGYQIPAGATGYFGAQTKTALSLFQKDKKIEPALGYFGPLTRGVINALFAEIASIAPSVGTTTATTTTSGTTTPSHDTKSTVTAKTSADATSVNGSDNDYATFEIELTIEPFGDDAYVSQNAVTAFTYQIENAGTGAVLQSSTATSSTISASLEAIDNYYLVPEDEKGTFTLTVTLNPLALDEGQSYRLQLLSLRYATTPTQPDITWNASPLYKFETPAVYIHD